jgi:uncharacterized RDD family membrane protein YckC
MWGEETQALRLNCKGGTKMYSNVYKSNYADFFKRFAAYLIDGFIFGAITGMLFLVMGYYFYFPFLLSGWLYFSLMESSQYQATLGKRALGIVVTDLNGDRISFGKATGRYFGKSISSILYIGFIMAAFSDKRQGLHDIMAGTLVLDASASGFQPGSSNFANNYSHAPINSSGRTPVIYGITGEFSGRSIQLDNRGVTLGRDSSFCQISFSESASGISRRHCTVNYNAANGVFALVDVGSSYGTFLESGMKIMQGQSVNLKPGERFYVGNRNNMFEVRQ